MAITLRQESSAGATTKGSSLTFAELDNNFIDLIAKLSDVVDDTTPQLGGDLDVNGNKIVSASNGNIDIEPNGTGNVLLGNFTFDADQSVGAGQDDYVLTYDHSAGTISLEVATGGGISDVVDDTTPQLGGNLDLNSNDIDGTGNIDLTGNVIAQSAINAQTGTSYTTVLGDASKLVTLSNASAITVTIPPNSSVAYPVGTKIDFAQIGAGQVTVAEGSGVTVNSTPTLKFRAQYSGATCIKTATDTWLLVGDLAES